jgi:tetratricopeptide (TPR) repeat protein
MSYPGNPSLTPDVQNRILTAFRQSVESAMRGNRDESLLGCDFVLRLDGQFAPARELQRMLDQGRPPDAYRALLDQLGAGPAVPLGAASPGLVSTFSRLLEARRFEELLIAAQAQAAAVAGDAKLAQMVATAQARFEAEPFVKELIDSARRALGAGNLDEVSTLIEKARALDPSHPGLAELERLRQAAPASAASLAIDWNEEPSLQVPPPVDVPPAPPPAITPSLSVPGTASEISFAGVEPPSAPAAGFDLPEVDFSIGGAPGFDSEAPSGEAGFELEEGGGDHGPRVQALLDEGQAAFDAGEYQNAIDSWSRIFLIDIDNQEAARRIEGARQLKAEREREVEELFHAGVARFDAGEWQAAREAFRQVLAVQPSYVLAREYLDKIDERESGAEPPPRLDLPELAPAAPAAAPRAGRPGEEILVPPDPDARRAREAQKPAVGGFAIKARRGPRMSPQFVAIGGAVLVLLGAGGWFLATNWGKLFPNSGQQAAPAPMSTNVVAAAKKLQAEGKTAAAIAQLRRIPPQDGVFAEAQSLVAQWEKLEAEAAAKLPAEKEAERNELLARARAALEASDHLLARKLFAQAKAMAPLGADDTAAAARVEENLKPVGEELALVRDGEYEMAMNRLWRRREAEPANKDIARLMVDAYYNLALQDLNRGEAGAARQKIREARTLDATDPMLERLEKFCSTYEVRKQDLLFRIFVKYLPQR